MRFLIVLMFVASPVMAQPFSKSMAECAALFSALDQWTERDDYSDRSQYAETRWLGEAVIQATKEGVAEPRAAVMDHFSRKRQDWLDRGKMVVFHQDFRDWTSYCRSFAQDRGIDFDI